MPRPKTRRWGLVILAVLLVLAVGAAVGYRIAAGVLKGKIVEALGPGSEVQEIGVGWSGVSVVGLRIKGPAGWPTQDALRAERVTVVPSLLDLLSGTVRVRSIAIERPYLSALRTKEGKLRVVPTLMERPAGKPEGKTSVAAPSVHISRIGLQDGVVELFDATVAQPPLKLRLEKLQASITNVLLPALTGKSDFDLTGILKGARQDGRIKIAGWAEAATKDSNLAMELRGVDLVSLQPYLSKAADVRVQKGALDLEAKSEVRKNRLRAPGSVTISGLEFAPSQGVMGTFMGVPRSAVVAFLKDKGDRIAVNFVIEGDVDNPKFSLNEALSTRMAASMAETLGVSIKGVAEGIGTLGSKGAEVLGGTAKGVGSAIQSLFGGSKNK